MGGDIRPVISLASDTDLEEILTLQKLAFHQEAVFYNDFNIAPLTQTLKELQREAEGVVILKLVVDGKIIGSVRAYVKEETCYIGRVIVHPDHQNRGIGKRLMNAIEEHFKNFRYELYTGYRSEKNLAFYEKLGYTKFDLRRVNDELQFVYFEKNAGELKAAASSAISAEAYRKFALYYDAYVGGFTEDIPLYLSFINEGLRVLEVGCGTGRVLKPLLDAGCHVTGVDISSEMLAVAEENLAGYIENGKLNLLKHNLCDGKVSGEFDRVFVTFYTFNYLTELSERERLIQNVYESLKPGGVIVIDLFRPLSLCEPSLENVWTKKEFHFDGYHIELQDRRRMDGDVEERIQKYINGDSVDEIITRRIFLTKEHMLQLLSRDGFKDIRFTDGYDIDDLHQLKDGEKESGSFVVVANK